MPVLATLSDGEEAIGDALKVSWPSAPHQRCQAHFLNNLVDPVLEFDTQLRMQLRDDLGGLLAVPDHTAPVLTVSTFETPTLPSPGAASPTAAIAPRSSLHPSSLRPPSDSRRDAELVSLEAQIRLAIRDAVNRSSRNPWQWGGLRGYQQLDAMARELHRISGSDAETAYLHRLTMQVDRAVQNNRALALELQAAHHWVERIAACLHYPPDAQARAPRESPLGCGEPLTSQQAAQEMEALQQMFQPDPKRQPAQAALEHAWQRLWKSWGPEL